MINPSLYKIFSLNMVGNNGLGVDKITMSNAGAFESSQGNIPEMNLIRDKNLVAQA